MHSSSDSGRGLVNLRHAIAAALAISSTTFLSIAAGKCAGNQFDAPAAKKSDEKVLQPE